MASAQVLALFQCARIPPATQEGSHVRLCGIDAPFALFPVAHRESVQTTSLHIWKHNQMKIQRLERK